MNYDLTSLPHNIEHHDMILEDNQQLDTTGVYTTSAGVYQNHIETNAITETGKGIEKRGNEKLSMKHEMPLKYQLLQEFLGKPPRPARKSQHMRQYEKTKTKYMTKTDCAL